MANVEPFFRLPRDPALTRARAGAFGLLLVLVVAALASSAIICAILSLLFGDLPDWLRLVVYGLQVGPAVILAAAASLSPAD